jgi:hypothetical protein
MVTAKVVVWAAVAVEAAYATISMYAVEPAVRTCGRTECPLRLPPVVLVMSKLSQLALVAGVSVWALQ